MSNKCINRLTVRGTSEEVKEFMDFAANENVALDFGRFLPLPAEAIKLSWEEKQDVCEKHWGTFANAFYVRLECGYTQTAYKAHYRFRSEWSPPVPVLLAASARFPSLRLVLAYCLSVDNIEGVLGVRAGVIRFDRWRRYEGYPFA